MKYNLFNINNYVIDTSEFRHMLHDLESELEAKFAEYIGADYAVVANSESSLMNLCLMGLVQNIPSQILQRYQLYLPSIIPIAVANVVHNSGMPASWEDSIDWVGSAYTLYDAKQALYAVDKDAPEFKIVDSAQEVSRGIFKKKCNDNDVMLFSLYPTKPVGGMDGGVLATNNKEKADFFRSAIHLGVGVEQTSEDSWKRTLNFPGWKLHANTSQCYVALKNLEKLDEKNEKLDEIRSIYNDAFELSHTSRHLYRIKIETRFIKKWQTKRYRLDIIMRHVT